MSRGHFNENATTCNITWILYEKFQNHQIYYLFKNLDQNDLVGAVEIDFMRIYDLKWIQISKPN